MYVFMAPVAARATPRSASGAWKPASPLGGEIPAAAVWTQEKPVPAIAARARSETTPPPGDPASSLPRVELALPLPKAGRAEDMIDRLTQLGLARLLPLVTERAAPHGRSVGEGRLARLARRAAEACKQSGNPWLPELEDVRTLDKPRKQAQAGAPTWHRFGMKPPGEAAGAQRTRLACATLTPPDAWPM